MLAVAFQVEIIDGEMDMPQAICERLRGEVHVF